MNIRKATADLPLYEGDITVEPESRFFEIADQRIVGTITIGRGCSHYELRNLYVTGSIRILGSNFHGGADRVWVDYGQGHGWVIGEHDAGAGNAMAFRRCFGSRCAWWGWVVLNQQTFRTEACSADQNGSGGFLASSVHGSFGLSAESNQGIGIRLYDCAGLLVAPFVDPVEQGILIDGGSQVTRL